MVSLQLDSLFQGEWNSASQVKAPLWSPCGAFRTPGPQPRMVPTIWMIPTIKTLSHLLTQSLSRGHVVSYIDVCLPSWRLLSCVTTESHLVPITHNGILTVNIYWVFIYVKHFMCITSFNPQNHLMRYVVLLRPFERVGNRSWGTCLISCSQQVVGPRSELWLTLGPPHSTAWDPESPDICGFCLGTSTFNWGLGKVTHTKGTNFLAHQVAAMMPLSYLSFLSLHSILAEWRKDLSSV